MILKYKYHQGDNESGSLFAKKETKAAPAYDYSRVPARTKTAANTKTAEETEMDERTVGEYSLSFFILVLL